MDKVNEDTVELIREAARLGAEAGYKAVYNDVRRNGSIRRALVHGAGSGLLHEADEAGLRDYIDNLIVDGKLTGSNGLELDFKAGEMTLPYRVAEAAGDPSGSPEQVLEKIASEVSVTELASQVLVDSPSLSVKLQAGADQKLSADQANTLSERVVSEVFYGVVNADDAPPADNGLNPLVLTVRKGLSPEELSRRIDAAIALSVEKLREINRYC